MNKRKKLDKVHCVDLECTAWESEIPVGERTEIIQVGICSLIIGTGEITNRTSYIIKPRHSTISPYCENLTGLSAEIVKGGMMFKDACNKIIKDFGTKGRPWASFGLGDKSMFEAECAFKNATYPFGPHYLDISLLFNLKYGAGQRSIGLKDALEIIGCSFVGKQHDASFDAYNSAVLLSNILLNK